MAILEHQKIPTRTDAEFRPAIAVTAVVGVLIPAGIAATEHGAAAWLMAALSATVAYVALMRIRTERALLHGRATTIAIVTEWKITDGIEGGHVYSVRYRFCGPDDREYSGKQDSSVEFPREEEMLPISYNPKDPTQNIPLATFWFYRFTYSGFADWMN